MINNEDLNFGFKKTEVGFILPGDKIVNRDDFICELCKNKKVLHLGCVDHPLLEIKFRNNDLLHQKLLKEAKELYGIDTDIEGLKILKEKSNIGNLFYADIENNELILPSKFEVIVAGEILEHLNNVGIALTNIYKYLVEDGLLIVTVPNALAFRIFFHTLRKRENIHPAHVSYFSPYTIFNFLQRYHFKTISIYSYSYPSTRRVINKIKNYLFRIFSKYFSFFSDGIIVLAKKEPAND